MTFDCEYESEWKPRTLYQIYARNNPFVATPLTVFKNRTFKHFLTLLFVKRIVILIFQRGPSSVTLLRHL